MVMVTKSPAAAPVTEPLRICARAWASWLTVLVSVTKVVDGHLRHGGIHQPNAVRAAVVARHVSDGGRHGDIAVGQAPRRRQARSAASDRPPVPWSGKIYRSASRVTVWPVSAVVLPLSTRSRCASAALMMLSSVRLSSVMAGGCVSTITTREASALLPLTLVTLTLTCARPSISVSIALAGTVRCRAVLLHLCGKGLIREFHHYGLPGLHALRLTRKRDIRAFFPAALSISSVVTVSMVTATAFRSSSIGCSAATVLPLCIFRADADGHAARRPCLKIRCRTPICQLPLALTVVTYSTLLMVTTICARAR